MVNEKFRERVYAWNCFKDKPEEFSGLFDRVLKLTLTDSHSFKEQTNLILFLDNCVNSLEIDLIRSQVQKICGLPMWIALTENRREYEFKKFPKLRKFWRAIEKNDSKQSEETRIKLRFERSYLRNLVEKFINLTKSELESGEVEDKADRKKRFCYMERFLELLIDLEALLPTRRFFNTILDDSNLIIHCDLSKVFIKTDDSDHNRLVCKLLNILKFYSRFEIDDQTGEELNELNVQEAHYEKIKQLQKGVFKYFRDDLQVFALTNIASIDKKENLIKFLEPLSKDRIYALAEYLHLVPSSNADKQEFFNKQLLVEIIVSHTERRKNQLNELNSLPYYPCETEIWDENLVPSDFYSGEGCLALPKLNLQFLTLHDYLLRNFQLFRLESAYELRQDIEDAIIRLRPYNSFEEETTAFASWSRMAHPIQNFNIIEIGKPNVGEKRPSKVRAEVTVNFESSKAQIKGEWDQLRRHDICFLITIRAPNPPEIKYNKNEPFIPQVGLTYVRGCEIEGVVGDNGKLIEEGYENKNKPSGESRTYRVLLDCNQYKIDTDRLIENPGGEDIYATFNVIVRRKPKENSFKAILESICDLMNTNFVVPEWLRDIILGYGDPAAAHYSNLKQRISTMDWNDTFLSLEHLNNCFPGYKIEQNNKETSEFNPPYRLTFKDLQQDVNGEKIIQVETYNRPNEGPFVKIIKKNQIEFTPTQIEAIKSGMQPGLTIVVGPPGTGKTDVAVQIISNLYHNFPEQKILIVTHSNQALNQLFEKIMHLDIDERHLLRLGHGEESLETEKDFSRYGRVNYVLTKRIQLLEEVDLLQKSLNVLTEQAYTCETAMNFYMNHIVARWELFESKITDKQTVDSIAEYFPFAKFYEKASQPLFKKQSFNEDYEIAQGCYRYIQKIFQQLEEFRAFELMRSGADRAEYLLVKEAKIVAMTCTHAALKRRDLVQMGFRYDTILMEEAAQILEIETFIPLLLQNPDHNGNNRLKRWIMIGDHHQLPPVIKNMAFQKYSNMEQSMFARLVKLGVPTVDLDAQGRARPSICDLFKWRYKNLGYLNHILQQEEFKMANAGLRYDYQIINVDDYNGQGESEPQPYFYQNIAEAEFVTAVYMYMRLVGYPSDKITILTTYNGQKHLIRDIVRKRCGNNPLLGLPKKISTVDKYQGQQNDYILLSLVKTRNIGHLRDVRRLIVAMSRARLGLYIFARVSLFKSCFELTPVFNILLKRPTQLHLLLNEIYPSKREIGNSVDETNIRVIIDMPEMAQFVYDYYQAKLQMYAKEKKAQIEHENKEKARLRLQKLNEEEVRLRERLNNMAEGKMIAEEKDYADVETSDESSSESEIEEENAEISINEVKDHQQEPMQTDLVIEKQKKNDDEEFDSESDAE